MTLPDTAALEEILSSPDPFVRIVRGRQAIDAALSAALTETLAEPHAVEIDRMSFALKIDLAVAFGAFPADSRPAYVAVNRIRNAFAHRHDAVLADDAVRDLYSALSSRQRDASGFKAGDAYDIRKVIAVLFYEARQAYFNIRDAKLGHEVLAEMARETLRGRLPSGIGVVTQEMEDRVARKKRERGIVDQ